MDDFVPKGGLTNDECVELIRRYQTEPRATLESLARQYRVSARTAWNAVNGKTVQGSLALMVVDLQGQLETVRRVLNGSVASDHR